MRRKKPEHKSVQPKRKKAPTDLRAETVEVIMVGVSQPELDALRHVASTLLFASVSDFLRHAARKEILWQGQECKSPLFDPRD